VQEDVSIRNLRLILEALINASERSKDVNQLTDVARMSLARELTHRYAPAGTLQVLMFSPLRHSGFGVSKKNRWPRDWPPFYVSTRWSHSLF